MQIFRVSSIIEDAGWSSPVARRAHNPKVAGSNPAPATIFYGGIAQVAEQAAHTRYVRGSNPRAATNV